MEFVSRDAVPPVTATQMDVVLQDLHLLLDAQKDVASMANVESLAAAHLEIACKTTVVPQKLLLHQV